MNQLIISNSHSKAKTENMIFLSKENIIDKHGRKVKMSFIDLTPYLNQEFGFIDPDFPHVYTSINENQMQNNQIIEWRPAQEIQQNINYSDNITTLQTNLFVKKAISHALIIINWFANEIFSDIFLCELSSHHLYTYDIMVDGIFMQMPIDSYLPLTLNNRKYIFTPSFNGSIFPCLYEKLLAKIYGDYESITSEFIDIVELQTYFCRQQISLTSQIKQKELRQIIQRKLQQKSVVSFRTRNSIRLQSFGLESNYVYIILRIIQKSQGQELIEFLQLDGEKWIGKHSKLRSSWLVEQNLIEEKQIIRSEEYKENYMSLSDMKGIGRQLIILNNTTNYHKNYYISQNNQNHFQMYRLHLNNPNLCMLRLHFKHKKCYSSIYAIQKVHNQYTIIKTIFTQNKENLYLELSLNSGEYYIIIYNNHPHQNILPYNLTLFTSNEFIEIEPIISQKDTMNILQLAFLSYFHQLYRFQKESIVFKQIYNDTGLAFIYLKSSSRIKSIKINKIMLEERKIQCVNVKSLEGQEEFSVIFQEGRQNLIIFRCMWSRKENIEFDHQKRMKDQVERMIFPPIGSIKVYHAKR